jgi:hypothetical protein
MDAIHPSARNNTIKTIEMKARYVMEGSVACNTTLPIEPRLFDLPKNKSRLLNPVRPGHRSYGRSGI